jgi:hypothetical protein
MNKKMLNTTVLKSTDSQRVGIKEILSIENSDGNNGSRKSPKSPRKPSEERIAGVIKGDLVPEMINVALKPVINHLEHIDSRLDRLEVRMTKVENRLDKQDEFNQYVRNVFERNNLQ